MTFYKVGHHGSLNATPKTVWNAFEKKSETAGSGRLISMLSTAPHVHGHADRRTEVPREKLVKELDRKSDLVDTSAFTPGQLFVERELLVG